MEKVVVTANSRIAYKFDGYSDMATYVRENHKPNESSTTSSTSWCGGVATVSDACDTMVAGYDDVLPVIASVRDRVRERMGAVDTSIFTFDSAVYGTRLDVGSYLADSPNCFLQFEEDMDKRSTKFVRILVDTTFSAMVKAEDIKTRGAAVVALCDTLNLCGYTTEVWAVSTNGGTWGTGGKHELAVMLPVQRAGEPWDVRSAMFPLAHPGFLRRLVFGVMESMTAGERKAFGVPNAGYGSVISCRKGSLADEQCGGADIICSTNEGEIKDITRDPVKWVLTQCRNLGAITDSEVV